ncbi:glycosyl hydrolase [Maribellus sediminis]|uniref:glycosyl hydrolase n=1 Tax=Maribellus sediminis TaxID=2696285 RepID=UPI00142F8986|nr:glycosyl hydrolase [Maribellus sediminis]
MRQTLLYIVFLLIPLCWSCVKSDTEPDANALNSLPYSYFVDPINEFRSHPFYSINDSLTEEEIAWQIKDFKNAGFGGFYLHSRSGLITDFLGDDWWKVMQAAVDAANESCLRCMFYDEDKWPSGYAGGIIPRMSKDYRAKCLAKLDKKTKLPAGAEIIASDSLYNYVLYTAQFGYDIFNGTCYVDLFNPEAVQAFIDVSYRPYSEKYRSQITTYTPAIFSDEPHVHARYFDRNTPNLGTLSYSPWLEKKFKELYGYDLKTKLPLLYEEKDNWREVRMQYYRAKALLFEESYTKQLSDFCAANNMDYTGHYLAEDVLQKVRDRAANTMLHYRTMQQPGMDMLGLSIDNKLITARNLSSVANQFGKQKRLSELFGISGQNMNFEDRKWLAGWHSILGVNHFCPHLTLYSMKGHRKRDYPPTFSYQQPYWNYNKKIEDYLGRIAYAASIGKYQPQLLVISPLESEYIKSNSEGEFTSGMLKVLEMLQAHHYDYDIGDEQIMADTAFVDGENLVIGEMNYQHILLPDMISIRQSTIDLIKELQLKGGLVFNTGRFPEFVDGKADREQLDALKNTIIDLSEDNPGTTLEKYVNPQVLVSGDGSDKIWVQTRVVPNGTLIQLANTSHTRAIRFKMSSTLLTKEIVLWDPSAVKCYKLEAGSNEIFTLELPASSNFWITSSNLSKEAVICGTYQLPNPGKDDIILDNNWTGHRLSPNALTLDFASYSTNGKVFSNPEPVIGIFNRLADQNYSGKLILDYSVDIEAVPANCKLVVEQPRMFSEIKVNGEKYSFSDEGFYIDHTFRSSDISGLLKQGQNSIQFRLNFEAPQPLSDDPKSRYGTEIESIYLTGDFAVFGNNEEITNNTQRNGTGDFQERPVYSFTSFSIGKEKDSFSGELTKSGYPFYAGAFELSQNVNIDPLEPNKNYFLELPNCEAIASVVKINGQAVDSLVWSPFKTDITEYLVEGENRVSLVLVNSLRNLLGPHHHKEGELVKVGPNSFTGAGGFPDGRGKKDWYDIRKTYGDNPIWTDQYYNIPFGLIESAKITSIESN